MKQPIDHEHIHVLLWAGLHHGQPALSWSHGTPAQVATLTPATAEDVGQMLVDANAAFTGAANAERYRWRAPQSTNWSAVALLKAVEYLQAGSTPTEDGQAARFCRALTTRLVAALPGYAAAPWGIGVHTVQPGAPRCISTLLRPPHSPRPR